MTTNAKFERDQENESGNICQESGDYFCDMHPYVEKFVAKGDTFPKCDQKGMPHNTTWNRIINEN